MSLHILGIDPGLQRTGMCLLNVGTREAAATATVRADGAREMEKAILKAIDTITDCPACKGTGMHKAQVRYDGRLCDPCNGRGAIQGIGGDPIIALEDFRFRSPSVSRGIVKHASEMGRLLGLLERSLSYGGYEVVFVAPTDSKALQPEGKAAKRLGIPGRNDHERSAFYVALWLAGSIRLAGGRT